MEIGADGRKAAYRNGLYANPQLNMLFFELTDKCNLFCKHCGSNCSAAERDFLPVEDIVKVLDSVAAANMWPMICLSGGEPFLHPDFFEIAEAISKRGFYWGITSNGTLIDKSTAQKLAKTGLTSIAVSLDGDRQTHNALRGSDRAFDGCIRGVQNLTEYCPNAVTMVNTVVHRDNFDRLEEIWSIVSGLNVDFWRVINIEPIGRAKNSELLLTPTQLKELFAYILRLKKESKRTEVTYGCSHYLPRIDGDIRDGNFLCGAGVTIASVLANGDYYACLDIERRKDLVQGNVLKDDFAEVWLNGYKQFRTDRSTQSKTCKNCEYRAACAGDSAHTWDFENNEPYYCVKCFLEDKNDHKNL